MQSLNLYLPEFKPDRSPLRANQMLLAAVVFVLLLILFSVFYALGNAEQRSELEAVEQQLEQLQSHRDQLLAASAEVNTERLDKRIEEAEEAIEARRVLRNRMAEQSADNAPALSAQMHALATYSTPQFALQGFTLQDSGRYVALSGNTRTRSAIPVYIQQLQQVPAFADSHFGLLTIREQTTTGFYEFRVGASEEGDDEQR